MILQVFPELQDWRMCLNRKLFPKCKNGAITESWISTCIFWVARFQEWCYDRTLNFYMYFLSSKNGAMTGRWMIPQVVPKLQEWCHRQKAEWFCRCFPSTRMLPWQKDGWYSRCLTVSQVVRMMWWHKVERFCKRLFPVLGEWCHDRKLMNDFCRCFPSCESGAMTESWSWWSVTCDGACQRMQHPPRLWPPALKRLTAAMRPMGSHSSSICWGKGDHASLALSLNDILWCCDVTEFYLLFFFFFLIIGIHSSLYNKFFLVLSVVHIWLIVCCVCVCVCVCVQTNLTSKQKQSSMCSAPLWPLRVTGHGEKKPSYLLTPLFGPDQGLLTLSLLVLPLAEMLGEMLVDVMFCPVSRQSEWQVTLHLYTCTAVCTGVQGIKICSFKLSSLLYWWTVQTLHKYFQ